MARKVLTRHKINQPTISLVPIVKTVHDDINDIGGARGVIVIVVGNGHGDMSSNPGRG